MSRIAGEQPSLILIDDQAHMYPRLPDLCPTCGSRYQKNELSFCSNGFHGCRDCTWEAGVVVRRCADHSIVTARVGK